MSKHNKILRYLSEHGRSSYESICKSIFKNKESAFYESLAYLKDNGLISVRESDQRTLHTCYATLTDKGASENVKKKIDRVKALKNTGSHILTAAITAAVTASISVTITLLITGWLNKLISLPK